MNKKFLLLPIIGSFLLTGCKINLFGKVIYLFEKAPQEEEQKPIDDIDPEEQKQHSTKMNLSPSKPFFLRVGETRELSVTYDPTPTDTSEIETSFSLAGDFVDYTLHPEKTTKNTVYLSVTGKAPGTSELQAICNYNYNLKKIFKMNVVDVDEDKTYLWQFKKLEHEAFVDKQVGAANLGGIEWEFYRSNLVKVAGENEALKFGLSKQPERTVRFTAKNQRVVSAIVVEAGSAYSKAMMTVKVGETKYIDEAVCERPNYDNSLDLITSDADVTKCSGDITIEVNTPAYDSQAAAQDTNYKAPGAFYIKSITIFFEDTPEFVFTKKYDFAAMYKDEEDTILHTLTDTAEAVSIEDDDFIIDFANARKESETIPNYAQSNGFIDIKLKRPNEVISKIDFKYEKGTTKNSSSYATTRVNGEPFSKSNVTDNGDGILKSYIFEDNVNFVRLINNSGGYVGLNYLEIKTRTGVIGTIKEVVKPEVFEPTKSDYGKNDEFVPDGLNDLLIKFNESGIRDVYLPASMLEWYDGVSYETNPATATKKLAVGTTFVIGLYKGTYEIRLDGITVQDKSINVTRVDSLDQITNDGKYYITCPNVNLVLLGSTKNSDIFKAVGSKSYPDLTFGQQIEFNQLLENEYVSIHPQNDGTYIFETRTGANFGLTDSGGGADTAAAGRPFTKFTITIGENGVISASVTANTTSKGDVTCYLGCNESSKLFKLYETNKANVVLYKVVA